jgi:phage terminase Nu1 subunit (DNA packaging protein)
MDVTYLQLSELTGKHKNTIAKRLRASTLTSVDQGDGKARLWPSAEALRVIFEAEFKQNGATGLDDLDYNRERARAEKERADKLELENARKRGELLEATDVGRELSTLLVSFKTKLSGLPSRLAAMVDDSNERRRLFLEAKTIVDEALIDMAKGVEDCTR